MKKNKTYCIFKIVGTSLLSPLLSRSPKFCQYGSFKISSRHRSRSSSSNITFHHNLLLLLLALTIVIHHACDHDQTLTHLLLSSSLIVLTFHDFQENYHAMDDQHQMFFCLDFVRQREMIDRVPVGKRKKKKKEKKKKKKKKENCQV